MKKLPVLTLQGCLPIRFQEGLPIRYKLRPFGIANKVQTFFQILPLGLPIRYKVFFSNFFFEFSNFDILPANKVQVLINHSLYPVCPSYFFSYSERE